MGFLDTLKRNLMEVADISQTALSKFTNRSLMEATLAATAMVCTANGEMKAEELAALHSVLARNEAFKGWKATELQKSFEEYYNKFKSPTMKYAANAEVIGKLQKITKGSEEAYALVGVCLALANADGFFDQEEKKTVKMICEALEINANKFGV